MVADQVPWGHDIVLTAANVADGQVLTDHDMDLGGLSRVVATVVDGEVVLYGEFPVEATLLRGRDPGEMAHHPAALCGIVEDWTLSHGDTVVLSAYVYVHCREHGAFGMSLPSALRVLNALRTRCLAYLDVGANR